MQAEAATLPTGSRFEDRYEVQGVLGSGSFGRVYRACQLSTGQSVAIKVLRPRQRAEEPTGREAERFRRETRICAALAHTNIVPLIDSGETDSTRAERGGGEGASVWSRRGNHEADGHEAHEGHRVRRGGRSGPPDGGEPRS